MPKDYPGAEPESDRLSHADGDCDSDGYTLTDPKPLTYTLSDAFTNVESYPESDRNAHARRAKSHARTVRMRRRSP